MQMLSRTQTIVKWFEALNWRISLWHYILRSFFMWRFDLFVYIRIVSWESAPNYNIITLIACSDEMHTSKLSQDFLLNASYNREASQDLLRVRIILIHCSFMEFPLVRVALFFWIVIFHLNSHFSLHFELRNPAKRCYTLLQRHPNHFQLMMNMTMPSTETYSKILCSITRRMHRCWSDSYKICVNISPSLM